MARFGLRVLLTKYVSVISYRFIKPINGTCRYVMFDKQANRFQTYLGNKLHGDQFDIGQGYISFERYRYDVLEMRIVNYRYRSVQIYHPEFIERNFTYQYKSLMASKKTMWTIFKVGSRKRLFLVDTEFDKEECPETVGILLYIMKTFADTGMIPEVYEHIVLQDFSQEAVWLNRIENRKQQRAYVSLRSMDQSGQTYTEM
jgi:hypothetical protein